jgi:hypothetical protein
LRTISAKLAAIATAGVVMAAAMTTSALLAAFPYVWGGAEASTW